MTASAKVIADSVSPDGHRLTTLEVVMHRFVLAEFNTHRMFSRNSRSSRAVPLKKTIKEVQSNVATPVLWTTEKKGMQGGPPLSGMEAQLANEVWELASRNAITSAEVLANLGVHKSLCNRLLEPFMWHTVIVSATEWDGFWWQRLHHAAQPEMRDAAEVMKVAYDQSIPLYRGYGQWHLPYVDLNEADKLTEAGRKPWQISAARCARVSYLSHDGLKSPAKDVDLYMKLAYRPDMVLFEGDPPHASPLEHVAHPFPYHATEEEVPGNFHGWAQLRHIELGF